MKTIGCKLPTCINCTIDDCQWEETGIEAYHSTDEFYFQCHKCGQSFPLCPYQELQQSAGGGGWFVCSDCAAAEQDEIIFGVPVQVEGGFLV